MYALSKIDDLIQRLGVLCPSMSTLTNDILPAKKSGRVADYPTFLANIHKASKKPITVQLHDGSPATARIQQFFNLDTQSALEVFDIITQISALNPVGAWHIQKNHSQACVLDKNSSKCSRAAREYILDLHAELSEILHEVQTIKVVRLTENLSGSHKRTRSMLRFHSKDQMEIAAIDAQILNLHLRLACYPEKNEYYAINMARDEYFRNQLSVSENEWPLVLHTLLLFSTTLPVTEIRLR